MTTRMVRATIWALMAASALLSACSGSRQRSAIERLKPCRTNEGPGDAYCGTLEVWEDRKARTGRKIPLKIVVLPALKQKYSADPVFFLAGGPGQGAAQIAQYLRTPFRRIQAERDIVLVDQRGTGKSNPLECKPKDDDSDAEFEQDPTLIFGLLRECLESYKDKADVRQYTTSIAMDDLDDVRRFLGYSQINVYGGSYGTRAAMVYAQRYPQFVRSVVLDGVAPMDMRIPLFMARDSQRALDLLFRDCENDAACARRFPNIRERLSDLLERLEHRPQKVRVVHPRTGIEREVEIKRITVTSTLFGALYSPVSSSLVPLLIEQAEKGNYSGFLAFSAGMDPVAGGIAQGMHFSVVCSEDASRIAAGSVERETAGTFAGAEFASWRLKPCEFWPKAQVDADYYKAKPSDVPALILSGELDPVTPPTWGEQVRSVWKNSKHVVVPGTGHGAWGSGCVMSVMSRFFNEGTASSLDTTCVQKVKRPPFFLGPSGPDPMKGAGR